VRDISSPIFGEGRFRPQHRQGAHEAGGRVSVQHGIDNDCDGEIDEGILGARCDLLPNELTLAPDQSWDEGVCALRRAVCVDGTLDCLPEVPYEPVELTCDGLDNDCNGVVDDTGAQVPGEALGEVFGGACEPEPPRFGPCRRARWQCAGGEPDCVSYLSPQREELLEDCDGVDNDCDGTVDEWPVCVHRRDDGDGLPWRIRANPIRRGGDLSFGSNPVIVYIRLDVAIVAPDQLSLTLYVNMSEQGGDGSWGENTETMSWPVEGVNGSILRLLDGARYQRAYRTGGPTWRTRTTTPTG